MRVASALELIWHRNLLKGRKKKRQFKLTLEELYQYVLEKCAHRSFYLLIYFLKSLHVVGVNTWKGK